MSKDVDLAFWSHLYLGIVPHFTATQLYNAPLPDEVDRIVAFNRGTLPDEFLSAGLSPDLAQVCFVMSIMDQRVDFLLLLSKDNRILSWLPIQFDSTVATGNVLVVKCD
ncbi:MAG TPA: hypothetical protein VFY71_14765 [Planctomycetota bacterium]|nr:hypothetical protein [Planctomycetota bacterium]